jgi:hypothetical protein
MKKLFLVLLMVLRRAPARLDASATVVFEHVVNRLIKPMIY